MAPGWQNVSWRAWKSFSRRRGILPQSASSVSTQIASNHICGPHQQNVHYIYLASSIVIFPSSFLSGDPTGSNILQPVGSEAPRTRASWPPPICSRPSQPLSGDHHTCLSADGESDRKEKGGSTCTIFLGLWDPFYILDMEVLSQGPMDRLRNGNMASIQQCYPKIWKHPFVQKWTTNIFILSSVRWKIIWYILVTKIWFQVFYDQFDTLVLEEMADAWSW